ncbi:MAG: hypothetical protein JNL80_09130 [Phycisphaerae bacterium]|jgi:alpha-tubulin suppressor-like RCC1 family protein|nr:hypothetical protein [Phycisphaerae bacterium]
MRVSPVVMSMAIVVKSATAGDVYAVGEKILHPDADTWQYSALEVGPLAGALVTTDGKLLCWGQFDVWPTGVSAALGDVAVADAKAVSIGGLHAACIRRDGSVLCWGSNDSGQCNVPFELAPFKQVVAGRFGTLALTESGQVVGWGSFPEVPNDLGPSAKIAMVSGRCAAIGANGSLREWGYGWACEHGACEPPANLGACLDVALGYFHCVALRADGTVACWGLDVAGSTVPPAGLSDCIAVAAADAFSCAIRSDGSLVLWGAVPPEVLALQSQGPFTQIAAESVSIGLLRTDGKFVGYSPALDQSGPTDVGRCSKVVWGVKNTLALREDGTIVCYGSDEWGQLDVPNELGPFIDVAMWDRAAVAITAGGDLLCWGGPYPCSFPHGLAPMKRIEHMNSILVALDATGGLHVGDPLKFPSDPFTTDVHEIAVGTNHWIALLDSGEVIGSGDDPCGEAGPPSSTLVFQGIGTGEDHSLAHASLAVTAWGCNLTGQLDVPHDLPHDILYLAGGKEHSVAAGTHWVRQWGLFPHLDIPAGRIEFMGARRFGTVVIVDTDSDDDGVPDDIDNCDEAANPGQADCNGDGTGDACDLLEPGNDCDSDGVPDNCEIAANPSLDLNSDGVLDACVPAPCLGDVTGNGVVDGVDLAAMLGAWGTAGQGQFDCDVNDDKTVDGADLAMLLGDWGTCS